MLERLAGALYGSACGTAALVPACSVFGLVAAIATVSPGWWVPALGLPVALLIGCRPGSSAPPSRDGRPKDRWSGVRADGQHSPGADRLRRKSPGRRPAAVALPMLSKAGPARRYAHVFTCGRCDSPVGSRKYSADVLPEPA